MARRYAVTVSAEFTFPLTVAPGKVAAEVECCATTKVLPGEPCNPWGDDPGSGPEIAGAFTDIMIDCGGYSRELGRYVPDWVSPDADMTRRIGAWLYDGHADEQFTSAAEDVGFGPDPDLLRDMRARG